MLHLAMSQTATGPLLRRPIPSLVAPRLRRWITGGGGADGEQRRLRASPLHFLLRRWSSGGGGGGSTSGEWRRHVNPVNALILANLSVFAAYFANADDPRLRKLFADNFILSNKSLRTGHYAPLVGHMFAHVDIMHLGFNMMSLYSFGQTTLALLGPRMFTALYFTSGLVGAAAQLVYFSNARSWHIPAAYSVRRDTPMVGASGAIAGIVTYACLRIPRGEVYVFIFPVPNLVFVPVFIAASSYFLWQGGESRFAHASHLGGALCGVALVLLRRGRY